MRRKLIVKLLRHIVKEKKMLILMVGLVVLLLVANQPFSYLVSKLADKLLEKLVDEIVAHLDKQQ